MKKKKEKESFFEKYLITFFWGIFLLSSLIGVIFGHVADKPKNNFDHKYKEAVLIFDHIEESEELGGENVFVYKYDVDGESYTYKEHFQNRKIIESGKKFKCYYNQENPQEIIKIDNKSKNTILECGIIIFFTICIILSIIGARVGGIDKSAIFSAIPLTLLFIILGIFMIISLFFSKNVDILAIIFVGGMGLIIVGISGFAFFHLIKKEE